jgi:putative transposase
MFRVSRFAEVLKQLPRGVFDRLAQEHQSNKHRKHFNVWRQFVAMVYAQLSGSNSLRSLLESFNAQAAHHYHLGCAQIHRSTLADANSKTDWRVFEGIAQSLMHQMHRKMREQGQAVLQLIDSTSITLKGHGFDPWTRKTRTRNTQGMKLHVLLAQHEHVPLGCLITAPNVNDLDYARELPVHEGVVYVFDRAYCDYSWWWHLTQSKARFVSRFKRNARLHVEDERKIPRNARGTILKDELVYLSNKNPGARRHNPYNAALRRIEVARENKTPLVLVTNDLKSSALNIAAAYKARWQIELFFKWIKQNLKIKRFLGRSENAVRIQILCALIAYLLVSLHAKANGVTKTLLLYLSELRSTLFQRPEVELHRHRRWRASRFESDLRQGVLFQ